MVLKFTTKDGLLIYMGFDKYENEKLIRWAFPTDVWFHVDDLSSAHVYLRLNRNTEALRVFKQTGKLDHLPEALEDCVQLVKANSIEGSKQSRVAVVWVCFLFFRQLKFMNVHLWTRYTMISLCLGFGIRKIPWIRLIITMHCMKTMLRLFSKVGRSRGFCDTDGFKGRKKNWRYLGVSVIVNGYITPFQRLCLLEGDDFGNEVLIGSLFDTSYSLIPFAIDIVIETTMTNSYSTSRVH